MSTERLLRISTALACIALLNTIIAVFIIIVRRYS